MLNVIARIKISKSVFLAYSAFILVNTFYFYFITINWRDILSEDGGNAVGDLRFVLNGDSLKAYFPDLEMLIDGNFEHFRFDHAISFVYYGLWLIFRYDMANIVHVAFVLNNFAIIVSYIYFCKIGRERLNLEMSYRWLYFLNPVLVFSSQMINKEAMLFAGIAVICYYSATRKLLVPAFMSCLILVVRSPFALLWPSIRFIFNSHQNKLRIRRLVAIVTVFLIASGYYASSVYYITDVELKGAGLAELAILYNSFYLGPLLFLPFKLIASFYDLISTSLWQSISLNDGYIVVYYAINIPIVVFLLWRVREIVYTIRHPLEVLRGPYGCVLSFIIVYLVIVAGNFLVHSRYLWPILPIMLLFLFSMKSYKHVSS